MLVLPFPCKLRIDSDDKSFCLLFSFLPLSASSVVTVKRFRLVPSCSAPVLLSGPGLPLTSAFCSSTRSQSLFPFIYLLKVPTEYTHKVRRVWQERLDPHPSLFTGFLTSTCSETLFLPVLFFYSSENAKTIWMKKEKKQQNTPK